MSLSSARLLPFVICLLLGIVRAQTCLPPGGSGGTYYVGDCTCNNSANGDNTTLSTKCIAGTGDQGASNNTIFYLQFQDDTQDYKWLPSFDQLVEAAWGPYQGWPQCTTYNTNADLGIGGYSSTQKYSLTDRCDMTATGCYVTGDNCISSTGQDLQVTFFQFQGMTCVGNSTGQWLQSVYDVIVQQDRGFESCWQSSVSTSGKNNWDSISPQPSPQPNLNAASPSVRIGLGLVFGVACALIILV